MSVRVVIVVSAIIVFIQAVDEITADNLILKQSCVDKRFVGDGIDCPLHQYRPEDVVQCLDSMTHKLHSSRFEKRQNHWLFMGDSRMRQQFYALIQLIPDYDMKWNGIRGRQLAVHRDIDVESDLFNVKISFRWRPVIDHDVFDMFLDWTTAPFNNAPDFLLIGELNCSIASNL